MLRIIIGYRRRGLLRNQLIAECTYAAMFAMRDSKGKSVKDIFPFLFEDDEEQPEEMSEEDFATEQRLMAEYTFMRKDEAPTQ